MAGRPSLRAAGALAGRQFDDLRRDLFLTRDLLRDLQPGKHVLDVAAGRGHGRHARLALGGERVQGRVAELGVEIFADKRGEQLRRRQVQKRRIAVGSGSEGGEVGRKAGDGGEPRRDGRHSSS